MPSYKCLICRRTKEFEAFDPRQCVDREISVKCLLTPKELSEKGGRCGFRNDKWTSE